MDIIYAEVSCSTNNRAIARNGLDASHADEAKRHTSNVLWQHRQEGFPDTSLCPFLFLCHLCRCVSFGRSFRVGIDTDHPGKLATTGVFAYSRNPIYVAFALVLVGQFLVFSNWILLVYVGAGILLLHRQVLLEEEYMKKTYGAEYEEYCRRVRRYV